MSKKYVEGSAAANLLKSALKKLPDRWLECRDMRHAWSVENNFHVVPQVTEGRRMTHIGRDLVCMRCTTLRHEIYLEHKGGRLEKLGQAYTYPENYQIPGVPRGVKPNQILQWEVYRRTLETVAGAARGERDKADR